MTANITNQVAFLRTSREFPPEIDQLVVELTRSYIDIANKVNSRTIGIYPINKSAITGNEYFFTSQKQQSFRQLYSFNNTSDIPLGFKISSISQFIQAYGNYIGSGTPNFGLIYGTNVAIPGQISFYFDVDGTSTKSDLIKFVVDAGAPVLVKGSIVVEWVANI